jgi:hypothetical protein
MISKNSYEGNLDMASGIDLFTSKADVMTPQGTSNNVSPDPKLKHDNFKSQNTTDYDMMRSEKNMTGNLTEKHIGQAIEIQRDSS